VILLGGFATPLHRLHLILRHAFASGEAEAEIELSFRVILPGGFAKPLHRLHLILCHALTRSVAEAQIELSPGVILLGSFATPLHRLHLILCHTAAKVVAVAQIELSLGEILLRSFANPLHRLHLILRSPSAIAVAKAQMELSVGVILFGVISTGMLSQELFYTFHGFSDDGAFYVAAFFPLTTANLPDTIEVEDWEAFHTNYGTYLSETTAILDQLPPSEFTPDLTLLDAVVTSLQIAPGNLPSGSLAYDEAIFIEPLPPVAYLELNMDPTAGLIAYQRNRQL